MKIVLPALSILSILLPEIGSGQGLKQGLFLERGIGIESRLEIGAIPDTMDAAIKNLAKEYGIEFEQDSASGILLHIKCDEPGCVTENNVGVGELEKTVIRRYGPPLDQEPLDDETTLIVYDGVAFIIKEGLVEVIYILPSRRLMKKMYEQH